MEELDEDFDPMQQMKYSQRSGTSDLGRIYEFKMLTLLVLRCMVQNFENFWLATNIDQVGDFDDAFLQIKDSSKNSYFTYMVQLKHRDNARNIKRYEFMLEKGDFSIVKCAKGFYKLKEAIGSTSSDEVVKRIDPQNILFVLYTNMGAYNCDFLENHGTRLDDYKSRIKFLNTKTITENAYMFNFDKMEGSSSIDNLDYCTKICLFVNQVHVHKLENLILEQVKMFVQNLGLTNNSVEIAQKFTDFVRNWANGKFGCNFYLTKQHVLTKLTELLLADYEIDFRKESFTSYSCATKHIWNDIVKDKVITIVNSDSTVLTFLKQYIGSEVKQYFDDSSKQWSYVLTDKERTKFYETHTVLKKSMYSIGTNYGNMAVFDIYKCLWLRGKLPLLLKMRSMDDYDNITKILKLSSFNFKVIILNKKSEPVSSREISYFASLHDLNTENRNRILDLRVKLQGRSSSVLRDLIDDTMYQFIKCSDIIHILLNIFNVGNTYTEYSDISEYFINRSLSKVMFRYEVFEKVENELFLVEQSDQSLPSTSHNLDSENDTCNESNLPNVINCKQNEGAQEFEKLKSRGKVIHWLKFHDDYYYEWKETFGSVRNIRQHQLIQHHTLYEVDSNIQTLPLDVSTFWIQLEDKLKLGKGSDLSNKTYIIDGSPGMGKTTLLDFIAQHAPPNTWVFKINLSEHDEYFEEIKRKRTKVDYIQHFKKTVQDCPNDHLAEMVSTKLLNERRVLYLMDGFDEIAISYKNEVTNLLRFLRREGYPVWVTTRSITKDHLEEELNTISVTLKPFLKNDQVTFLIKYFTQACIANTTSESSRTKVLIKKFTTELLESQDFYLINKYSEFLGIPLQVKLLGEVFSEDLQKYLKNPEEVVFTHRFDLLHLYTEFIEKKNDIFYKKNKKARLVRDLMFHTFENHQHLLALKSLFCKEDLIELNIDQELEDYNEDKQKKLQFLLIEGVVEKDGSKSNRKLNVRFVHRTFAEYFAAQWLYLSIKSNNEKVKDTAITLMRERFQRYRDYWFLFNIFDRMAAKNNPLHLAIIDGRTSEAKDMIISNPEIGNTVDECNRSVIHMAALYGINASIWTILSVVDHMGSVSKLAHMKDFVGCNALYYAIVSNALAVANKICEKSNDLTLHSFIDFSHKQMYFLLSCISGNIFKHLLKLLFSHFSLTDILLKNVPKTCSIQFYCHFIYGNELGDDELCDGDDDEFFIQKLYSCVKEYGFETISEFSASILSPSNQYYIDLHLATAFGSKRNVQDLLEKGYKVNQQDVYSKNTPLHYAIIHERSEIVELLLSNGADVNKLGYNDNTSLHFAVKTGNISLVKTLSEQTRSQINRRNSDNDTPLHVAIINSYNAIVEFLLARSANCDTEMDQDRNSCLHYACQLGTVDIVSSLLNKGSKVNSFNSSRQTPLHFAVEYNEVDIVKLLTSHNADLDIKDIKGYSPLHYAAEMGYTDIVEILLQAGTDNQRNDNTLHLQHFTETTPLHLAARNGYVDIVKLLLTSGNCNTGNRYGRSALHGASEANHHEVSKNADVDTQDTVGNTPIHLALIEKHVDTAKVLLAQCENINATNSDGNSLLHYAVLTGNKGIVLDVLSKGADINTKNNMGKTPLNFLVFRLEPDSLDIIKLLLSKGADCNIADTFGKSPLHYAMKVFINNQANIKLQNHNGQTPFHLSVFGEMRFTSEQSECQKLCVDLLLKSGANVNLTDMDGNTPLHLASRDLNFTYYFLKEDTQKLLLNFREYVVNLLVSSGADVNIENNKGKTAIDLANEVGHTKIVSILQNKQKSAKYRA